ncbi:MAG: septal ring lytic transglycosylase RlpA family protein [Candidatus Parcubacteria bacterium]|nr:septal ring lytic transglycosylase RlpA family protein [Candidatus Parcubacteria bacterium]
MNNYKNTTLLFLVSLTILGVNVNSVFAAETAVFSDQSNTQPNLAQIQFAQPVSEAASVSEPVAVAENTEVTESSQLILLRTEKFELKADEVWAGKTIRAFDKKFAFQIEEKTFKADATLELKEYMLAPASTMQPKLGFQMASKIYEYNLITDPNVRFDSNFWFSIKYDAADYFRKTLFYYDQGKNEWLGLESLISNGASKIIASAPFTSAKLAILEDITLMTEGTASWYKYKGCNCAASPDYPKGTKLKVTNIDNGKSVVVKINDWGPDRSVHPNRVIDLDITAFKQIAKKSAGLCKVKVELYEALKVATK